MISIRPALRAMPALHRWEYVNALGHKVTRRQDWVRRTCTLCYKHERSPRWK